MFVVIEEVSFDFYFDFDFDFGMEFEFLFFDYVMFFWDNCFIIVWKKDIFLVILL